MNARNVEDLVTACNHRNESIYKITKYFLKLNKRKKFKKIDSEDQKKITPKRNHSIARNGVNFAATT